MLHTVVNFVGNLDRDVTIYEHIERDRSSHYVDQAIKTQQHLLSHHNFIIL